MRPPKTWANISGIPREFIERIDKLLEDKSLGYLGRNDFARDAMRHRIETLEGQRVEAADSISTRIVKCMRKGCDGVVTWSERRKNFACDRCGALHWQFKSRQSIPTDEGRK